MHLETEHSRVQQSESLTLEGWTHPLPLYLVEAVDAGVLVIHQGKGFQYLQGTVVVAKATTESQSDSLVNPQGTVISFQ